MNPPRTLDVAKGEDQNRESPSPKLPFLIQLPKEPLLRSLSRQLQALDARDSPRPLGIPTHFACVTYVFTCLKMS